MNGNESLRASLIFAHKKASFSSQVLTVFGAALGLCFGFAPVYFGTLSIFLKPIAQEFGWDRAETSGVAAISMLGLAAGAILAGRLLDRYGAGRVISFAVVATAALIGLLSKVGDNPIIYLLLSLSIGFVGAGTTPPGYLSVLSRRFDKRLGLALGVAGVGMGVGTIFFPILANFLVSHYGWRQAYVLLAILSGAMGLLACVSLFAVVDKRGGLQTNCGTTESGDIGVTAAFALRGSHLWLLLTVVMFVAVASLGVSVHFVSMLTDRGMAPGLAAKAAAFSGAGVISGRFLSGYLIDRYHAPRIAAITFMMAAGGALLLIPTGEVSFPWMSLSGFLIGFALGSEGDFLPFFVAKYFGMKEFGTIYGMLFFVFGLGGVLGPVLFGLSFDRLHSYSFALWGAATLLGIASALVVFMGRYRYSE